MTAADLAVALRAHRSGATWMACCPAHEDVTPSLAIRDAGSGQTLVHCHAGCSQAAVIEALRARGLWEAANEPDPAPVRRDSASRTGSTRRKWAMAIWHETVPAPGSLVETYLASRGLRCPDAAFLRFHPRLKHPAGGRWPAMVSLVTDGVSGDPTAIHRTFIARDGSGKAPVDRPKMMLGPTAGGAVRLAPAAATLLVGEGIETVLSVMQATGIPAWAALSTSGLLSLALPADIRDVIVLADSDDPGIAAARAAALRWQGEGRVARIARPPGGAKDFNDALLGRSAS